MPRFHAALLIAALALALTSLSGCAPSTPHEPTTTAQRSDAEGSDTNQVCTDEYVVGSHVPRRVCRDEQTRQEERDTAVRSLENSQRQNVIID